MGQDHRRIRRFAVQIPCLFGDGEEQQEGTILNLSDQGCAMMTQLVPPVSSYLPLRIDLPDGTTAIEIELAAVRWVFGHRCGLEFISLSPEMLTELRSFVLVLENTP